MSILAAVPGGSILSAVESAVAFSEADCSNYVEQLAEGLTGPQREVWEADRRFKLLCSGRRFGKTYLCITRLICWAMEKPGSLCWYVTANYRMAKQIAWRQLKAMAPEELVVKRNESDLSIEFANGSLIALRGADNEDSLRGVSLSALVIDEAAYVKQTAWEMVLRPALSDQNGPAWFITTPAGLNWFHDLWEQAQEQADWDTFSFTTIQGGNVSAEEIEAARNTLDERTFRQEYLASFETLSGRVYPGFDDENISEDVRDTGGPIYWGTDFNVSIMAGVLGSRVGDTLHIWDELAVKQSNTDEVCALLKQRFPDRQIVAYPDPTGSARKTSSAGRTDHDIIRRFGFSCISPKAPWSVKDKINATNWMIRTAKGSLRLFVHPRCKHTIKALKNVTYKQGAEDYVIDKSANIEHWTDGLGYLILGAFNPLHERAGRGTGIRLY
ncbi:MAG: terminase [Proteobacteria bacterium]|jgi:phage terminase large subunit|nr:MAG: terminase [Pseudomonadota bacterium]REJ66108.1 MAG: terminase [Pseudomonadota bacterium]